MASNACAFEPARALPKDISSGGTWPNGPLSLPSFLPLDREGKEGHGQVGARGRRAKSPPHSHLWLRGWWFAIGCLTLVSLTSCRATVGHVIGQQFVSPTYAFTVPLPGDEWQRMSDEPSLLTLAHAQLAAGITISVTCDRERDAPLSILTRHLFFGFKDIEVLQQGSQVLNGVSALKTVARGRLDGREVQLSIYVVQRDGCVYDMVYFATPQDYGRGEPGFERMMAGWRFL